MNKNLLLVCMLAISVLVINIRLQADEGISEEIFFMDMPVVFSASKMAQPISEAPSSIYVITAKDIEQSGAINISELLRMVPGLEVPLKQHGTNSVTARGFGGGLTDRMLTMIDGRSVYMDSIGTTYWDTIPNLYLEDIERIEIIRGAGSALYGANAFCGVINIYTKSIENLKGTKIDITGGELNTYNTGLIHANMLDTWGYKISASGSWSGDLEKRNDVFSESSKGYFKTVHKLGNESKLFLSGGASDNNGMLAGTAVKSNNLNTYFQTDYTINDLKAKLYYNNTIMDIEEASVEINVKYSETYSGEIQNTLIWHPNNTLIYGTSYRYLTIKVNDDHQKEYNLTAIYLQNNTKLSDKLSMLIGGRYDYHSIIKGHTIPRVVFMYYPVKDHVLRASYGEAFRDPNSMDLFSEFQMNIAGSELLIPGGLQLSIAGNEDIKSEKMKSVELGYRGKLSMRINTTVDLFFNKLEGLIDTSTVDYQLMGPMAVPKTLMATNAWNANAYGGEIGFDFTINELINSFFNYSYQKVTDTTNDTQYLASPEYKFNLGLKCKFDSGITANLLTHYLGKTTKYADLMSGTTTSEEIDSYMLVNVGLGYQVNDNMKVSMYVFNLLNNKHKTLSTSDEITKRITGTVSYKF